jgi:hypothetical protein
MRPIAISTRLGLCLTAALVTSAVGVLHGADQASSGKPVRTIKDGVLDSIVLYAQTPPADPATRVVITRFSMEGVDLGTGAEDGKAERQEDAKTIVQDGPKFLAERFVATLKEQGPYTSVAFEESAAPASRGLTVEGKFTKVDPGSRAKRYFVGFGAGKSTVAVEGAVKGPDGGLIATFTQQRHGVMGMGGGDSRDKLLSDSKEIGADIAKFVSTWAKGGKLK